MTTRESGYLRVTTKTAKGKKYTSWQWRTHHHHDLGHKKVDLELGSTIWNMRTRTYVALGELKSKTLVERYARWHFPHFPELKAYTGDHGQDGAAWWISFPAQNQDSGKVKLRFRSGTSWLDFRDKWLRDWFRKIESDATDLWNHLNRDPIVELARLQWQEQQANDVVARHESESLPALCNRKRDGDISKRDFEADEREYMMIIDGFQDVANASARAWDEHLAEMVSALPRTRRQELKPRIIAIAQRYSCNASTQNRWHADQWSDHVFRWWPSGGYRR